MLLLVLLLSLIIGSLTSGSHDGRATNLLLVGRQSVELLVYYVILVDVVVVIAVIDIIAILPVLMIVIIIQLVATLL